MTGHSPGTIPTSNDVSHYDPSKSHHRAWLQAVLDRLVQHEPKALGEGSELRDLWKAPVETKAPAESPAAAVLRHPNPLVGVPRYARRDSAQLTQRDRNCFSSSCAMLLEAVKPGTRWATTRSCGGASNRPWFCSTNSSWPRAMPLRS